MKTKISALLLAVVIAAFSFTGCAKIVKIGEEGKLTGQTTFNAGDNVEAMWDSKAVPELTKEAVDLSTVLQDSKGDLSTAAKKYGKTSSGTSGSTNFVVKGTGKVTLVDQKKKAGYMQIQLNGYSGKAKVQLQIGTVYRGTSVRDSLSFIKYEDYKNQVQWAEISQAINKVIQKEVVDPLNVSSLTGKTVAFTGCLPSDDNDELVITPVKMSVK